MKAYTITLLGNGAYYNRGCEAIVRGTIELLQASRSSSQLNFNSLYLANNSTDKRTELDPHIKHYPVTETRRFSGAWVKYRANNLFPKLIKAPNIFEKFEHKLSEAPPAGAVLLLGGDNATMHKGRRPQYAFEMIRLAQETGVPVIFWGASIGPFCEDPEFELWAVDQLRGLDLICPRETQTYNYLQSLGLKDNLQLMADPSFWMKPSPCVLLPEIETLLSENCIGINFSPLVGDFYISLAEWTQRVVLCLKHLARQHDGPILLIPHVIDERNYKRNDRRFMEDVLQMLPNDLKFRIRILTNNLTAAQTKWVISRTQVFAGCRTHSTLAAISTFVPTICISYSAKARGIALDTYDNFEWLLDGHNLVPEEFAEKVLNMCNEASAIRGHLRKRVPMFEERAFSAGKRVMGLYASPQRK